MPRTDLGLRPHAQRMVRGHGADHHLSRRHLRGRLRYAVGDLRYLPDGLRPGYLRDLRDLSDAVRPSDLRDLPDAVRNLPDAVRPGDLRDLSDAVRPGDLRDLPDGLRRTHMRDLRHLQPTCLHMRSEPAVLVAEARGKHRRRPWAPPVGGDLKARALQVAKEVAGRLRSRERLLAANRAAAAQTRYPRTIYWEPFGIAQGDAGLALMCSYLDACFPAEEWDSVGHDYLTWAVQGAEDAGRPPLGLFAGLAGLAFAARALSRSGMRYRRLLDTLDAALCSAVLGPAGSLAGRGTPKEMGPELFHEGEGGEAGEEGGGAGPGALPAPPVRVYVSAASS